MGVKTPSLDELRALAEKVNHDKYCGCSSMAEDPSHGVIDCELGALMKAFREFCDHKFKPIPSFNDLEKCEKCGKLQTV